MANYCYSVPILPGGEEKMTRWIQDEIMDNPNHDRVFGEAGVYQEQVWIQRTPMGDFAVVRFGTDDPAKTFRSLAMSTDPWAVQFRAFLLEAHGIDVSKPSPLNEQVLNWSAPERSRKAEKASTMK